MELSIGKILLILVVVVVVFGTGRLPKIGEDLGKALRGFKKGVHEGTQTPTEKDQDPADPPRLHHP